MGDLQEIVRYIIRFLLGEKNSGSSDFIGYTSDTEKFQKYRIVIFPSRFFDKDIYGSSQSLPELPLQAWEGIPLLFGTPRTEKIGATLVLYADIIASTFFLISRYEEMVNRSERDAHGRFPGRSSLSFRAGFLQRPMVEEYGKALRKILLENGIDIPEPPEKLEKIYLTHDADQIAHYRNFRGMSGALSRFLRNPYQAFKAVQTYWGGIENDPWFTFPWMLELANELKKENPQTAVESIVFIKSGGGELMTDKPLHNLKDNDFRKLFEICHLNNVKIGLHPSYRAGEDTSYVAEEKKILDEAVGQNTVYTRNHFLRNREPEDFLALIDAGLTDDFTMAYADVAGFRLGTCRAVRWINPATQKLTSLVLHPTAMMDSTLSDERYMKLRTEDAFSFSKMMIDRIKKHNGELILLWHNTSVEKENGLYHRDLYQWIINYLKIN